MEETHLAEDSDLEGLDLQVVLNEEDFPPALANARPTSQECLQKPDPAILERDLEEPEASPPLVNTRVDDETMETTHFRPISPSISCMEAVSPSGLAIASPCSTCPPSVCQNVEVKVKAVLARPNPEKSSIVHGNLTRSNYVCNGKLGDAIKAGAGSA